MTEDRLNHHPVEHRAEHAVVVEAGGEPWVELGLLRVGAVHHALVEVGGAHPPDATTELDIGRVVDLRAVVERARALGYSIRSRRPLCSTSSHPSSMSMLGVPYSPIVPSLTRWQPGAWSRMAKRTLSVPTMLLVWVSTAWAALIIENGADRCSAKWTIASGCSVA